MKTTLSILALAMLSLSACGADDDSGGATKGGSSGSGSGGKAGSDSGGKPSTAAGQDSGDAGQAESGGDASAGSSTTGGAGNDARGGNDPGEGDCELEPAVVSCEVDSGNGVRVCTEVYVEGVPEDTTRDNCSGTVREGEHCPDGPNLVGYCKGGISTYYYAPADNDIWMTLPNSCPLLMGVWCE